MLSDQTWSVWLTQIAKFMGPTRGPPGSCRPQMGPVLAPWTLLSENIMESVGLPPCITKSSVVMILIMHHQHNVILCRKGWNLMTFYQLMLRNAVNANKYHIFSKIIQDIIVFSSTWNYLRFFVSFIMQTMPVVSLVYRLAVRFIHRIGVSIHTLFHFHL